LTWALPNLEGSGYAAILNVVSLGAHLFPGDHGKARKTAVRLP
jgi:hypothetical protein